MGLARKKIPAGLWRVGGTRGWNKWPPALPTLSFSNLALLDAGCGGLEPRSGGSLLLCSLFLHCNEVISLIRWVEMQIMETKICAALFLFFLSAWKSQIGEARIKDG